MRPLASRLLLACVALGAAGAITVDAAISHERPGVALGLAAGAALGAAFLLLVGVYRPLVRQLGELSDAARRIVGGDGNVRVRLPSSELRPLAEALQSLTERVSRDSTSLALERDLMASILEGMQDGVLLLDEAGRVVMLNAALRESLLLSGEVTGRASIEVIRHAELQSLIARARDAAGQTVGEIEVGGLKPRRLLIRGSRLLNRPNWLLLVFLDVTDIRRLETMRRDFVANVSHELRTPVTAIRSAAETLQGGALADAEAAPRFVDIVNRNAERLQNLVEDLLDLSRIESKQYALKVEPLNLRDVLEHTVGLLAAQASKRNDRLVVTVADDAETAACDRRAFEQIVTNLVDNAIKYCPPGTRITTRTRRDGDNVRISIEDTGPGIDQRHLPRLFERFYRVDPGRSREQGGTGLGLSIVKHLVEAMGGDVGVDSPFGQGTTFWFTVPHAQVPATLPSEVSGTS